MYKIYITDSIQGIAQGVAHAKYYQKRYVNILKPQPQDNRSGDEIAADIIKNAGLKIKVKRVDEKV